MSSVPERAISAFRLAAPAMLIAFLLLAPFYDKAFTIDDPLFLNGARQILSNPLQPGSFDIVWDRDVAIRMSAGSTITGPIDAYLLVPSVLAGGSEPIAHLMVFLLLCGSAAATVSIALRLGYEGWRAACAAVLLVSTPAVLGMASNNMPDLPAMAFGVMAVERFFAWESDGRVGQAITAALLLAVAFLTRSHMVLLLGVLGLPPLLRAYYSKPGQGRSSAVRWWWLPLASALIIALLFQIATRDTSQRAVIGLEMLPALFDWHWIPRNLIAFGVHWVLAFPLGIVWLALRWQALRWYLAALLTAGWFLPIPQSVPRWAALIAILGFLVIFDAIRLAFRRQEWAPLSLGLWLLLGLGTVPYVHHPAKYEVPAAPAAALLIAGRLPALSRRSGLSIAAVCVVGAVLGVAIIRADAVYAASGRQMADDVIKPFVQSGKRVWFTGHWGFQWYAEKAGASPLTSDAPHPAAGDLIVASFADECPALAYVPRRTLLKIWTDTSESGQIMSRANEAGFYSNILGYLPWSWGSSAANRFELWEVQ
ncbi:MAG: hypothetical protein ABI811_01465 [Acidobacteriota bacterium]